MKYIKKRRLGVFTIVDENNIKVENFNEEQKADDLLNKLNNGE